MNIMKKFMISLLIFLTGFIFTGTNTLAKGNYGPHWTKQVIKVYIADDSYTGMMQRAFQKWVEKSNSRLKFEYVTTPPADIEVDFADETDGTDGDIGCYSLTIKGGAITKANIIIAPNPTQNSNNLIYTVMLHEIGHALGLNDSSRKLGIMSTPVTENQDIINTDMLRLFHLNGWTYIDKNSPAPALKQTTED